MRVVPCLLTAVESLASLPGTFVRGFHCISFKTDEKCEVNLRRIEEG